MKKKLAIICANTEQIPLVLKSKEMGIETHCFSWEKTAEHTVCKEIADYFYPISILEKEQILEKCKEIKIDGVTSIMNDYAAPTVAFIAQNMGLTGNGYEDSLIPSNKYKARQAYLKNGANSPRFAISKMGQIPDLTGFKYPLIVKPTDGRASIGVMKVDSVEELQPALLRAQKESFIGEVIIEEFIGGSEVSVETISWQGKHYVLAVTDKITTGAPYFVEIAHHIPSQHDPMILDKIKDETQKALDALNFQYGASHVELKVNEDKQVYIIEVNARMGGDYISDLVRNSTGQDFVRLQINVAL